MDVSIGQATCSDDQAAYPDAQLTRSNRQGTEIKRQPACSDRNLRTSDGKAACFHWKVKVSDDPLPCSTFPVGQRNLMVGCQGGAAATALPQLVGQSCRFAQINRRRSNALSIVRSPLPNEFHIFPHFARCSVVPAGQFIEPQARRYKPEKKVRTPWKSSLPRDSL